MSVHSSLGKTLAASGMVLSLMCLSCEEKSQAEKEAAVPGDLSRVSVHDPSIVRTQDESGNPFYYIFGTHIVAAGSTDLANWKSFTNGYARKNNALFGNLAQNLAKPFEWAGCNDGDSSGGFAVWAPDVIYNPHYVNEDGSKGAWMIYFCTSSTATRSCIAFGISNRPDGGYTCVDTLVYSGFTETSAKDKKSSVDKQWTNTNIPALIENGLIPEGFSRNWAVGNAYNMDYAPNAIDPGIFFDADGKMWMTYGSWSGGIFILELDPATGKALYPGRDGKTDDGRLIDRYFGTQLAGGHTLSGEGPFIVYDEEAGWYYLYTTYNYLDSVSGYNMRLFRSKNPDGPYVDAAGRSAVFEAKRTNQYERGIKVMGNYKFTASDGYRSPGHCSAFVDTDGSRYLIYHTRFASSGEFFEARVHQQFLNSEGWPVTAVFENRGDKISPEGYGKKQIAGEYEIINHGTVSDGSSVKEPRIVKLKSNGTITGEKYNGTWKTTGGTYYADFEINGIVFHGVFFEQHDESRECNLVMTFTAIGENNETVWGVKIK